MSITGLWVVIEAFIVRFISIFQKRRANKYSYKQHKSYPSKFIKYVSCKTGEQSVTAAAIYFML